MQISSKKKCKVVSLYIIQVVSVNQNILRFSDNEEEDEDDQ